MSLQPLLDTQLEADRRLRSNISEFVGTRLTHYHERRNAFVARIISTAKQIEKLNWRSYYETKHNALLARITVTSKQIEDLDTEESAFIARIESLDLYTDRKEIQKLLGYVSEVKVG